MGSLYGHTTEGLTLNSQRFRLLKERAVASTYYSGISSVLQSRQCPNFHSPNHPCSETNISPSLEWLEGVIQ